MLTRSHLCPSSLPCSLTLSSTFTHSTSLSLPPASMHSLKLCLIASHHSQQHCDLSACLSHICTHTHTHTEKEVYPAPTSPSRWNCLDSWRAAYCTRWPRFDFRTRLSVYLGVLQITVFHVTHRLDRKERCHNRASEPWWYFKVRSFFFFLCAVALFPKV